MNFDEMIKSICDKLDNLNDIISGINESLRDITNEYEKEVKKNDKIVKSINELHNDFEVLGVE